MDWVTILKTIGIIAGVLLVLYFLCIGGLLMVVKRLLDD